MDLQEVLTRKVDMSISISTLQIAVKTKRLI